MKLILDRISFLPDNFAGVCVINIQWNTTNNISFYAKIKLQSSVPDLNTFVPEEVNSSHETASKQTT